MVKNIVFDIGKVLIGFDWDAYIKSLFDEETAAKVSRAMFRSGHWPELDRAVLSEQEILELFYSVSPDVKEEIDEAFDRIGECVAKRDWPCDLIKTLKDRGYGVYYLSNMSRHVIDSNPEAFAFTELMDGGVFSCNVHLIKPDLAIYRKFLDTYGLKAEECLFVDDHEENVVAARQLGMKAIRFESHEQMETDLQQELSKDKNRICEFECNIDDMTAEELAYAAERLMTEGAKDVTLTPIQMKKGRPATLLTCDVCR